MRLYIFVLFLYFCGINCNNHDICSGRPCIKKCCSVNQIVYSYMDDRYRLRKRCDDVRGNYDFTSISMLDKYYVASNESLHSYFDIIPGIFNSNLTFRKNSMDVKNFYPLFRFHLTEEGVLIMEVPNAYKRWNPIGNHRFCVDYTKYSNSDSVNIRYWMLLEPDEKFNNDIFLTTAMLISSVFLLLVLIVYGVLPELRNLGGMILMAYVTSLFCAFVLLAVIRINKTLNESMCVNITCSIYFFFLSTFCWMNVMSYDIWWTFRGYAKARPIHRRGENFKFCMYSIYAFGVPLAMTIFLRVVNDLDLTHVPGFVKPNVPAMGCFISDGQKLVYLYIPMLILIICNWLLYLMTAYNLWRLSRGTAVLDSAAAGNPQAHRTHRHRFLLYLKLSIVMGLNWVLEVVSFLVPSWRKVWWVTDGYNILIGVAIFVIFVCKPTIMKKLTKLVKIQNKVRWIPGRSSRSNTSSIDSSSQETQTVAVCSNPKGPQSVYTVNDF